MLALVCRPHVPHLRCIVGKVVQVPHQSLPGTALQEFEALGPGEKLGMVQLRGQGCCWRRHRPRRWIRSDYRPRTPGA